MPRSYLAPAKLNLFLHITGRRADGYHLLQSAFMLIDWCDELQFEIRLHDTHITREDLSLGGAAVLPEQDLCVRAAQALQAATACPHGAHIRLQKYIPSEAGMGGGSSDAATCLLALNELWQLNLSRTVLAEIGLQLGADVPFFVHGQHAWVEGIGEQIQAITLPPAHFLVIKPRTGVSTPAIFQHPDLKRNEKRAIITDFAQKPYEFGYNAMQVLAQLLNPQIGQAIELMARYGLQGRMTGSGSAVFAKLETPQAPPDLLQNLPAGWVVKTVSNLQQHPSLACVMQTENKP